jgi:hypothetical protein
MKLFLGMMQRAGIQDQSKSPTEVEEKSREEFEKNYRPNRAARRAMNKMRTERRWDKRLADHYGIGKAFRSHATRHGGSVEMVLSEMLQQGAIKYRPMPEDGSAS